jgi:hypothetical protein
MKITAKTAEGRLRQFIVLRCKQFSKDEAWMYDVASGLIGRTLVKGFGLTTCSKPELIQIADHIKTLTGGTPGVHRAGPRGERRVHQDPTGVVTYLASREQRDMILSLAREVFYSAESPAFRGFLAGMVKRSDVRLLTRDQGRKVIEALTSMSKRGWRPRGMTNAE